MAVAAAGHLALPIMLGALCEEGEAQLLGEARALYEHHDRDAGDTILMAFRAENWTKVSHPWPSGRTPEQEYLPVPACGRCGVVYCEIQTWFWLA